MSMFIEGTPLFLAVMDTYFLYEVIPMVACAGIYILCSFIFPRTIWKRQYDEGIGCTIHLGFYSNSNPNEILSTSRMDRSRPQSLGVYILTLNGGSNL